MFEAWVTSQKLTDEQVLRVSCGGHVSIYLSPFPRVRPGAAGPPVPGCSIAQPPSALPGLDLEASWHGAPGEATATKCVYFELVLEDGMFQGRICLEEFYWEVIKTISRSLIENLKHSHTVSLTVFQSQRRLVLAGLTLEVRLELRVSPNKRCWVTEPLSVPC